MGCNDNFEPNKEECNGCINWKYGTCMYEERRRIRDSRIIEGKMKLNETEKTILEYLRSVTFHSIYRTNALYENDIGQLWAKREDGIMIQLAGFGNFFEEIKNGEEYNIQELLGDEK